PRAGPPPRTERGAALALLAGLDVDPLQMPVEGVVAVAVVEDDEVAVAAEPLRPHHLPLVHGDHLGALRRANVDAVVVGDGAELGVDHPAEGDLDDARHGTAERAVAAAEAARAPGAGEAFQLPIEPALRIAQLLPEALGEASLAADAVERGRQSGAGRLRSLAAEARRLGQGERFLSRHLVPGARGLDAEARRAGLPQRIQVDGQDPVQGACAAP